MRTVYTVCTTDYQWYLPTWAWSARQQWPDAQIRAVVRGPVDDHVAAVLKSVGAKVSTQWITEYPYQVATTSALRFVGEIVPGDEVLITDADVVFLSPFLWVYAQGQFGMQKCCAVWQGAWHHPKRKAVAPNMWIGEMRRSCAGYAMVSPQWYAQTKDSRRNWAEKLANGSWGSFREADEVMLCRVCVESGVKLTDKKMDWHLRGLHLGDFVKPWRWMKIGNMRRYLTPQACKTTEAMLQDKDFLKVLNVSTLDSKLLGIWTNVKKHLKATKGVIWM